MAARCRSLDVEYRLASGRVPALVDVDAVVRSRSALGHHRTVRLGQVLAAARPRRTPAAAALDRSRSTVWMSPGCAPASVDGCAVAGLASSCRTPPTTSSRTSALIEQVELAARLRGVDPTRANTLLDAVGSRRPPSLPPGAALRRRAAARGVRRWGDRPAHPAAGRRADRRARCRRGVRLWLGSCARWLDRGVTLVVASHDAAVVDAADHVVQLRDGRVEL